MPPWLQPMSRRRPRGHCVGDWRQPSRALAPMAWQAGIGCCVGSGWVGKVGLGATCARPCHVLAASCCMAACGTRTKGGGKRPRVCGSAACGTRTRGRAPARVRVCACLPRACARVRVPARVQPRLGGGVCAVRAGGVRWPCRRRMVPAVPPGERSAKGDGPKHSAAASWHVRVARPGWRRAGPCGWPGWRGVASERVAWLLPARAQPRACPMPRASLTQLLVSASRKGAARAAPGMCGV